MKIPARLFLIVSSVTCLMMTGGTANSGNSGGGHSAFQHNKHSGDASNNTDQNGAAKKPKSAEQPKGTVVRDHGDKPTKTTTTTSCYRGRGHHAQCATVRDHTSGEQGDWKPPPRGPAGPAGGPNSRKPPS